MRSSFQPKASRFFGFPVFVLSFCIPLVTDVNQTLSATTRGEIETPATYHVSPDGIDDQSRDGQSQDWRNITFALSQIPPAGHAVILVAPGEYTQFSTTRQFEKPVIIRAASPHQSVITPGEKRGPVLFNRAQNLVLEGFVIDNRNNPSPSNAVQLLGGASHLRIANNIITHGQAGYISADAIKIHRDVHHVLIEENLIYDAMDEEIDIEEGVHDVVIRRNVLYRHHSPSQKAMVKIQWQSRRILIEANLFFNSSQENESSILQLGGGITAGDEPFDLAILNNVFLHTQSRSMLRLVGCKQVLLGNNLFLGHPEIGFFIESLRDYPDAAPPLSIEHVLLINNQFIQTGNATLSVCNLLPADQNTVHFIHNHYFAEPIDISETPDGNTAVLLQKPPIHQESMPTGAPTIKWLEHFHLPEKNGFLDLGIPPEQIILPDSLSTFLHFYYGSGDGDAWYRQLRCSDTNS
ncbi:MAG: hypothetical protein C4527_16495 [Candidatus Omnitrophota bacterium]|jgi:hypothetical protein|nr:MAG: hypothetical protein C4527_16495 [Candidatus Omnitrophota bacterium]